MVYFRISAMSNFVSACQLAVIRDCLISDNTILMVPQQIFFYK